MRDWMKLIPEEEQRFYKKAGFLGELKPGRRAALIVVDVTMGFCGSKGATLDEAVREYSTACGPDSWDAMPKIAELIGLFRTLKLPIVYSLSDLDAVPFTGKATKGLRTTTPPGFNDFPKEITPRDDEYVLPKTKASTFFQTPLNAYLVKQGVDTLFFCGVSTSGCVRASVVDGFSNGFQTIVVDECCFDRSRFADAANLFDMNAKYAAVVSLEEAMAMLRNKSLAAAE
jgi:nicotinamidase-related amidase